MKAQHRLYFVLAIFAIVLLSKTEAQCVSASFQACSSQMTTFIGYDVTPANQLWINYTNLYNFLQAKFSNTPGDANDLYVICNGFEQFYGCLNQPACYSVGAFLDQGLSPFQAYSFVGLLRQYRFMCGAGFYTALHENLPCLQRVVKNFNTTLTACQTTYQLNVQHDPNRACQYMTDLTNCYAAPFDVSQCRREGAADRWWACETQRNFALSQFPSCALTCDLQFGPPPAAFVAYMTEHYKFATGQHWFKMPQTFVEKSNGVWQLDEGQWIAENGSL